MSEIKRYTAWAAEVALPRGTMVVLAADYDALKAELATERLRADAAVGDANAAERRVAELESLARVFQTWLGASRDQCDESGRRLWDRIDAALSVQQQGEPHNCERDGHLPIGWDGPVFCELCSARLPDEPCQGENCGTTTGQHSRECIEEAARDQGWIPTEEDFNGCAKAEQAAAADERKEVSDAELLGFAVDEEFLLFCDEDEFVQIARSVLEKFGQACAALAPAAVAMPARMTTIPEGKTISYAAGYEDALDAVARLNRCVLSLELLQRICADALRGEFATADRSAAIRELRAILGAKP